ncbi:MAG: hypothetical protein AAF702_40615 [Chloroflexota bacterium]
MNNVKRRVLILVSGLTLALMMSAVSDGSEHDTESATDRSNLQIEFLLLAAPQESLGDGPGSG